jgi:hypothetical protein
MPRVNFMKASCVFDERFLKDEAWLPDTLPLEAEQSKVLREP